MNERIDKKTMKLEQIEVKFPLDWTTEKIMEWLKYHNVVISDLGEQENSVVIKMIKI